MTFQRFLDFEAHEPEQAVHVGLMLAVKPDAWAAEQLHAQADRLKLQRRLTGRPTDADRLHATLVPLHIEQNSPAQAAAIAKAMRAVKIAPFRVMFDQIRSWTGEGRRPLVATSDEGGVGLSRLQAAMTSALDPDGVKRPRQRFTPHVTLMRDPQPMEPVFIDPIAWTVNEVQLIFSIMEERRHIVLQRWALKG